jgi:hypothetical protein
MKLFRLLPILALLIVEAVRPSFAAQGYSCSFNSQLCFNGTQWQVKSSVSPIYLARKEDGAWRVLAVFDGTNGKYHLDWENPAQGEYVALDPMGAASESVKIGEIRAQYPAEMVTSITSYGSNATAKVQSATAFHRRAVEASAKP